MKRARPDPVDDYISAFPEQTQKILRQVRSTIRKAAPDAGEKISYGIPTFTVDDHYLIYFAGFKKHISIYPAPRGSEQFKDELAQYRGGKGTVQFPVDKPIPFDLIARIVKFRLKENSQKVRKPRARTTKK